MERKLKVLKGVLLLRQVNQYQSKEEQIAEIEQNCSDKELDEWIEALKSPDDGPGFGEEPEFLEELEFLEENMRYTSCTAHDYSPSNPWDAPGMSVRDFISLINTTVQSPANKCQ